ncbi:MAG: hypothetical protein MUE36_00590 [Acidimicrobiales bacterium]|jgi:hypothetical protein|nr:hypothetical protein [Acidimicrobiales bacterium]
MAPNPAGDVRQVVADTLYVGVGFGLMAVQALQVRRRELERQLGLDGPPSVSDLQRALGRLPGRR